MTRTTPTLLRRNPSDRGPSSEAAELPLGRTLRAIALSRAPRPSNGRDRSGDRAAPSRATLPSIVLAALCWALPTLIPALALPTPATAQPAQTVGAQRAQTPRGSDPPHRLPLTWDRWLDHDEITERLQLMERTWPEMLDLQSLGSSYGGREMWLMTINNPATGDETEKAAMFIEANVHGNEIQGAEVILYTIWYLMENYDRNAEVQRIVDERVFYLLPSVNPDGRDFFLDEHGSGARTGHIPVDSDGDGLFDEDGPEDLNGNGVIEMVRKHVPGEGNLRVNADDPRILEPVPLGQVGDWVILGQEGIDNDGDGRVNEDPIGGYDPNRNYGSDWQPNYIQRGSMDYPFQLPEARAINDFMRAHPNIAGFQSYHNSGGMILRPPGSAWYGDYPPSDIRVYDELGENGERILPYYDYLVIWQGLYTVHGGSIDWTNDGLGIISFSNELWNGGQYFNSPLLQEQQQAPSGPLSGQKDRFFFDDRLELGDQFVEWAPFDHPTYGEVELGGWKKLSQRVNPRFMSMELFHRNMAFTLYHADQMPRIVAVGEPEVENLGDGLLRVRVSFRNERLIPTITAKARENRVVRPDLVLVEPAAGGGEGEVEVIAAGWVTDRYAAAAPTERIEQEDLSRILVRSGLAGRTMRTLELLVRVGGGSGRRGGGGVTVTWDSVKGGRVSVGVVGGGV